MKIKQHTIAIVDDDPDDLDILAAAFRENNEYNAVLTFSNAEELLAFLETAAEKPDLVITDLYMPIMTGADLIASMKSSSAWTTVPVVLLSTIKNELVLEHLTMVKGVYYFLKPVSIIGYSELADTIIALIFSGNTL